MKDTIIYLVRHAETVDENGIRNTNEDSQMINEKEILSVEGEEQAKKLSKNNELKNEKGENKKDYLLIAVDVFIIVTIIIGFLAYKKRSKKDDV